jgi:hypothetical protein
MGEIAQAFRQEAYRQEKKGYPRELLQPHAACPYEPILFSSCPSWCKKAGAGLSQLIRTKDTSKGCLIAINFLPQKRRSASFQRLDPAIKSQDDPGIIDNRKISRVRSK